MNGKQNWNFVHNIYLVMGHELYNLFMVGLNWININSLFSTLAISRRTLGISMVEIELIVFIQAGKTV